MLETYSRNRLVWPVALVFTFIAWILNGWLGVGGKVAHEVVLMPFFDYLLGMLVCAAAVYLLAEINTRYTLVTNSDRTISLTMMLLIAMATFIHPLQFPQLVMICYLVYYFILLGIYQSRQAPVGVFSANLALGVATLVCPQLVWMLIVSIFSMGILRALSPKCFVAALLGVVVPYWFWGVLAPWLGGSELFSNHLSQMTAFGEGGLGILSAKELWSFWVTLAMFVVGGLDFFMNIHLNRSRMRMNYYVFYLQGAASFLFLWIEPQLFMYVFPLCMVNTSILFGHFTSTAKGRLPDILLSVILILWLITTLFIS